MMGRDGDATEAELAILQVIWEEGPATVRRLTDRLYATGGPSAHTTVHKLLERLEAKGFVRRDRSGPIQVIAATISCEALIEKRAQALADALCGGSLVSLLSHLVDPRRLRAKDRKDLRDFFNGLDQDTKPGKDRGRSRE
jgi:BlaI family transcriptional regulator, penicillinase repressor